MKLKKEIKENKFNLIVLIFLVFLISAISNLDTSFKNYSLEWSLFSTPIGLLIGSLSLSQKYIYWINYLLTTKPEVFLNFKIIFIFILGWIISVYFLFRGKNK